MRVQRQVVVRLDRNEIEMLLVDHARKQLGEGDSECATPGVRYSRSEKERLHAEIYFNLEDDDDGKGDPGSETE